MSDEWIDDALIYSAKHVGAWDDKMSKELRKGKRDTVYIDVRSLKRQIQAEHTRLVNGAKADILIWATGGIKEFTEEGQKVIQDKISELTYKEQERTDDQT